MSDLSAVSTPGFSEWDEFTKSLQSHSVEEVLGIESHGDTQDSTGEEKSPTVGVKVEDTMLNFIYSDKICGLEPEEGFWISVVLQRVNHLMVTLKKGNQNQLCKNRRICRHFFAIIQKYL
ncbi:uncharacterized protein LOC143226632 isoform X6 [Tachypleus tridentatus]|uniref:uncharacterized protein LOC143226632 isoform X6 n=1 Tax=Tachypleus tridentatus TaxID=6853 RepID=UPI003FD037B7